MTQLPTEFVKNLTLTVLIFAGVSLSMISCGGSLFKVKPVVQGPLPETAREAQAQSLAVKAATLLSDEENQEMFEANLPLNGLLPVRVELTNKTGAPLPLEKARFLLRDASGQNWKTLSVKQTVSLVLDANGVFLYNPNSRKSFQEAIQAHALNTKTALAPNERRQGLLFFRTPKKQPVESPKGLSLSIDRVPEPVEVKLT